MKNPNILFTGGGSGGPVAPLLAVAEELKIMHPTIGQHWAGTRKGPEKRMVDAAGISFTPFVWAKLRRYFDLRNLLIPMWLKLAFFQAIFFLAGMKPRVVVSAGGFVSVPIVWAAWVMRIPTVIHQQDVRPGLANKLMKPCATVITSVFKSSAFPNARVIGNPVRNLKPSTNTIKMKKNRPVVLIMGGGTGAAGINRLVTKDLLEIAQVIHLTGNREAPKINHPDYHAYAFLGEEMAEALNKADLIVTRAGMSALSEVAELKKPAIIIPMPDSHQEDNAAKLKKANAAIVLNQKDLVPETFNQAIKDALKDKGAEKRGERLHDLFGPDASKEFVKILEPLLIDNNKK